MTATPQDRLRLVRELEAAPDLGAAIRLARRTPELADEATARLLLGRVTPLPVNARRGAEASARAAAALARIDRSAFCRGTADRLRGVAAFLSGRTAEARRRLQRASSALPRLVLTASPSRNRRSR